MPVPTSNQGAESKRWLVPLLANCEARRVVGRRLPSLIGLTPLLFLVCEYAQPVGAGPIRGPALMPRDVCCPRRRAPPFSPVAEPAALLATWAS